MGAGEISEEQAKELEEVKQVLERTNQDLANARDENQLLRQRLVQFEHNSS